MRACRRRGATLMECLVSIFLVCTAVFSVMKIIPMTAMASAQSDNRIHAAYCAKSVLDDGRKRGFAKVAPTTGTFVYAGLNDGNPYSLSFNYRTDVTVHDTDRKLVTATVTWTESSGEKRLVLQTLMVDTGK